MSSELLSGLNNPNTIIILGRGHGGTRAMSKTLRLSGVFTGEPLNPSEDLIGPEPGQAPQVMYDAAAMVGPHVTYKGDLQWNFDEVHTCPIEDAFIKNLEIYLATVINSNAQYRGWKLPENTLAFPYLVRLFPKATYIHWIRDPRDNILKDHVTDDLERFNVPHPETDNIYEQRAISWIYQYQLVNATPRPARMIDVRFEDFITKHEESLARLTPFLGFDLARIDVDPSRAGVWKTADNHQPFDFLQKPLTDLGYDDPIL